MEEEGHAAAELNFKSRAGNIFHAYVTFFIFYDEQGGRSAVITAWGIADIKRTEKPPSGLQAGKLWRCPVKSA
jgi:hypothetical protein